MALIHYNPGLLSPEPVFQLESVRKSMHLRTFQNYLYVGLQTELKEV